jgi:hypothetical protein
MRSGFNRMKRYYSAQTWRIKLILSVVMIIFARSKAGGISGQDINQIGDVTGHQKQQTGKFTHYLTNCDKMQITLLIRLS